MNATDTVVSATERDIKADLSETGKFSAFLAGASEYSFSLTFVDRNTPIDWGSILV